MIAAGIMGGIGVALMFLIKQQTTISSKSQLDADIAQVKSQIVGLITSPVNCNANFFNRSVGAGGSSVSVAGIYECKRNITNPKCAATITGPTQAEYVLNAVPETVPGIPNSDINWPVVTSGIPKLVNNKNLKISKITSTVQGVDTSVCTAASNCITNVSLVVDFSEKITNIDKDNNVTIRGKKLNSMTFNAVVVTNGTTVLGCPKSWNSTVLY